MAHPNTEIRDALWERINVVLAPQLPTTRFRERAIAELEEDLPALNLALGNTDVEVKNETPREEKRSLEVRVEIKAEGKTGAGVSSVIEAYADVIERNLPNPEFMGLDYIEKLELQAVSYDRDSEGQRVAGLMTLQFLCTYTWDYPERSHEDFDRIVGGIDHDQVESQTDGPIDTPIDVTLQS
jgi:hypothetical protein